MTSVNKQLLDAARVIQLDRRIRAFLEQNDPKALAQLEAAIAAASSPDYRITTRQVYVGSAGHLARVRWEILDQAGKVVDFGIERSAFEAQTIAERRLAWVRS
jgi:hypothetical protein